MGEIVTKLYACCPICTKPIGRSKRIDGLEITCPKCLSVLKVTVDQDTKVLVELIKDSTLKKQ